MTRKTSQQIGVTGIAFLVLGVLIAAWALFAPDLWTTDSADTAGRYGAAAGFLIVGAAFVIWSGRKQD